MEEHSHHDLVIIGGGAAGLRAAIAAAERHPRLNIAVISKVYPMRSHTVSAEGGAGGVIKPTDTLDDHIQDTISGSDWLADQDAVEAFAQEAPRELLQLEHWGCPWSREPDGSVAVRPFGGMKSRGAGVEACLAARGGGLLRGRGGRDDLGGPGGVAPVSRDVAD